MDFGLKRYNPNKTPAEIINEGAFGGTFFRDIYSGINGKWYRNSWKEFDFLRGINHKLYSSNYYDVNVNKYDVNVNKYFESGAKKMSFLIKEGDKVLYTI